MNDEHLMLLGSIKADLEYLKKRDELRDKREDDQDTAIGELKTWRNGLVAAGITAGGIFTAMGVTLQKAIADLIHQ